MGNYHVRFLGGKGAVRPLRYPMPFKKSKTKFFMNQEIEIYFDEEIAGYVVRLPELTTIEMLINAKSNFEDLIAKNDNGNKFSLLLDTNTHEFESIECLKFLRSLLSIPPITANCTKYASVAPENHTQKEIKSDKEASFNDFSQAYAWLCKA